MTLYQRRKVIVRVLGGLGNQLFIYAFARSVSLLLGIPVYLEYRTGFIKDEYKRKYLLDNYNIRLNACHMYESMYFPIQSRIPIVNKLIFKDTILLKEEAITSNPIQFLTEIKNHRIFLTGYWQNVNYFSDIGDQLRNELELTLEVSKMNKELALNMHKVNSVAIHVRNKNFSSVLNSEYYKRAIAQIKNQVENPVFFIFSDDINWCKKNVRVEGITQYIENNFGDELQELWLMSNCKHFILAKSTFSWWGAWLSKNQNKIVIKPKDYLNFNFHSFNA